MYATEEERKMARRVWRQIRRIILAVYVITGPVVYFAASHWAPETTLWQRLGYAFLWPLAILGGMLLLTLAYGLIKEERERVCPACGAKGKMKEHREIERDVERLDEHRAIAGPPREVYGRKCATCGYFHSKAAE